MLGYHRLSGCMYRGGNSYTCRCSHSWDPTPNLQKQADATGASNYLSELARERNRIYAELHPNQRTADADINEPKNEGLTADEVSYPIDFSGITAIGSCPKCGANVYPHDTAYVCEKSVGPGSICTFRTGKVVMQQPIDAKQMSKLLGSGKTDLLEGFISARTHRKFSAFLALDNDGKVGFEFVPKAKRTNQKTK